MPSAPYHGVSISAARSTRNAASGTGGVLPNIPMSNFGKTNLAYFDGHAASFKGDWIKPGDGPTIRPYWQRDGGTHTTYPCP